MPKGNKKKALVRCLSFEDLVEGMAVDINHYTTPIKKINTTRKKWICKDLTPDSVRITHPTAGEDLIKRDEWPTDLTMEFSVPNKMASLEADEQIAKYAEEQHRLKWKARLENAQLKHKIAELEEQLKNVRKSAEQLKNDQDAIIKDRQDVIEWWSQKPSINAILTKFGNLLRDCEKTVAGHGWMKIDEGRFKRARGN